jgi:hypothetical protein
VRYLSHHATSIRSCSPTRQRQRSRAATHSIYAMNDPAWPPNPQRAYEAALKATRTHPPGDRWAAVPD